MPVIARTSRIYAAAALLRLQRLFALAHRAVSGIAAFLTSPAFIIFALIAAGTTCAVFGVLLLLGQAWALITAACILFVLAGLFLRGVTRE